MSFSSSSGVTVYGLICRTSYLLLDFDGPVCDIFAGLPAPIVAGQLRKLIVGQGITLPGPIAASLDPIEVFIYSATVSPGLAAQVEAEMADQETAAVPPRDPLPTSTTSSPAPASQVAASLSSATTQPKPSAPTSPGTASMTAST